MGQIANQMAADLLIKLKEKLKDRKDKKKKVKKTTDGIMDEK